MNSREAVAGSRLPALAQTALARNDPWGSLARAQRRYGDVFACSVFPAGRLVVIADPTVAATVLAEPAHAEHAGTANAWTLPGLLAERSVFATDGAANGERRRRFRPAFDGELPYGYRAALLEATEREISTWPSRGTFPLLTTMRRITQDAVLPLLVTSDDPYRRQCLRESVSHLSEGWGVAATLALQTVPLPRPWQLRLLEGRRAPFKRLIAAESRERDTVNGVGEPDMLEVLRAPRDNGQPCAMSTIQDELVSLLVAAHDVQAVALTWAFERLARHPAVLVRLRAELDSGRADYLDAVVSEVLRTRPPVIGAFRLLEHPTELRTRRGTVHVPGGTLTMMPVPGPHHRDESDATSPFAPEIAADIARSAGCQHEMDAFGAAPRRCLGADLARRTLRTVLAYAVPRVTVRSPLAQPEAIRLLGTVLLPGRGGRVTYVPETPSLSRH